MRHNPLAQILDYAHEERRHREVEVAVDRRAKIHHYRDADIRRAVRQLNLGEK